MKKPLAGVSFISFRLQRRSKHCETLMVYFYWINFIPDERLMLVAVALAGYLNVSSENNENSIWKNMCMTLSNDMKDPYLRSTMKKLSGTSKF
jgi:hypothetical protein